MRQLGIADLFVVLGVAVLLWLGRTLLPEMQSPARVHPEPLGRGARQMWTLPRRPLFWVLVGLLALLAVTWVVQLTPK
jgi:hypothetical protein